MILIFVTDIILSPLKRNRDDRDKRGGDRRDDRRRDDRDRRDQKDDRRGDRRDDRGGGGGGRGGGRGGDRIELFSILQALFESGRFSDDFGLRKKL